MNPVNLTSKSRLLLLALLCLLVWTPSILAQAAPPASEQEKTAQLAPPPGEEVIKLSPFEVVSDTKGYFSANTMSGTRFNTKLADLASSITVMTKQQMSDFAMVDINDIFLYVAGTEGTGTYTDYTLDRNGSISDNVQINPTTANRVRGIAPANVSLGNFETMNRVPIDPVEVESVEISRGPNANVFGLGNPSGTVNLVPTSANLTRDRATAEGRVDSNGGWRTSLDVNHVLLKDKLAVRVSGVFQHDGFDLKPSGVDTERYKGMIKYRPFKNTTITASVANYHAYGTRPNSLPPRDNISYWVARGKPTWDPVTMTIHVNGQSIGPITATTFPGSFTQNGVTYNTDYFRSDYLGNNHNQMFIDQRGLVYWSAPQIVTSATTPTTGFTAQHFLQTQSIGGSTFSGTAPRSFDQPLFNTTPTISDKSIYDWSSINLSAANRFWDRTTTYLVQLDQIVFDTQRQTLAAQAAFFREDSDRWQRNLLGIANDNGQSGQLMIDINERLLDGSPNPFFMRPYVASDKPRTQENPQKWDTTRGQLAYRLDLTQEKNLLKWLGWFQVTGYGEYKYRVNRQYSWRDAMISPVSWIPAGTYVGTQSAPSGTPANLPITSGEYRFYVGDANSMQVQYAPRDFSYGSYPFNWVSRSGTSTFTYTAHADNILLGPAGADKTGRFSGDFNTKTVLKTAGVVGQSHLFGDRLVTTLGWRNDTVWTKYGNKGNPVNKILNADGVTINYDVVDGWEANYFKNGGHTTNVQFVLRPFMDTSVVTKLGRNGGGGHFVAELLNGLSLTTNKSNSFLPTNPAQDLYKNLLPNTTGTDKSWGLGLNLFNDTLQIRATHYDNRQNNAQTTDISTMAQRVLRIDFLPTGAGSPTPSHNLYTNATRWVTWQNPTWSADQVAAEVERQTGLSAADRDYYQNPSPSIGATTDVRSVGTEVEINYNPTRYWTVAAAVTKTKAINTNVSKALVNWIDDRMPVWTTIVDPSISDANAAAEGNPQKLWWKHHYTQSGTAPVPGTPATYTATAQTPEQNFIAFVQAPFGIIRALEGKSNPQVRPWSFRASTSVQLSGLFDNKHLKRMSVGGALRWEDQGAIGYYGLQQLPAVITDLDPNRPIYDKSHYYVDLFASYRMKLWSDKVGMTLKFNVRNLGENGRLQPVGAFPDGSIHTFRIVNPQLFIFTASFDL
jgi:hypothetical protein